MTEHLSFDFNLGSGSTSPRRASSAPMRILVLGDFRGAGRADAPALAERRARKIDVDNFDARMSKMGAGLTVEGSDTPLPLRTLDDLHPDELLRNHPALSPLLLQRARLKNPATFSAAAAALNLRKDEPARAATAQIEPEEDAGLLDRLLGADPVAASGVRDPARGAVNRLISTVMAEHTVAAKDPSQAAVLAGFDSLVAECLRAVLHDPQLRRLETLWRGLYGMVSNLDTDESLSIHTLDVSAQELAADFAACGGDLSTSAIARAISGPTGDTSWSLLCCDYQFGTSAAALSVLAGLGTLAAGLQAPLFGSAHPALLGCATLADLADPSRWGEEPAAWKQLRAMPFAPWVALALPRLLQRQPYGKGSDAIDSFSFEEIAAGHPAASAPWTTPAFRLTRLLAEAFLSDGWQMVPDDNDAIDDLPVYAWDDAGERALLAVTEVELGERAATSALERGVMPIMSVRNQNRARLVRFQSIAAPAAGLRGPWH